MTIQYRAVLGIILVGCTSVQEPEGAIFQEVIDLGAADYLGVAEPISEVTEGSITTYTFDAKDGPACLRGDPYRMASRPGDPERLFLFLQGGGACWSDLCLSIELAMEGVPESLEVLDPAHPNNPMAGHSLVYLPYCDGSMFGGDIDIDDDGDGEPDRLHRGLRNLSAGLDVAKSLHRNPSEVVLAGSSGGGYGTILASVLVRIVYPDAKVRVFNDAGVGLGDPDDLGFVPRLLEEFGAEHLIPEGCTECFDSGHLTDLLTWILDEDPGMKVATYSTRRDMIISDVFLGIGGESFEAALLEQTSRLEQRAPKRYYSFLVEGTSHTALLGDASGLLGEDFHLPPPFDELVVLGGLDDTAPNGLSVGEWMGQLVNDDPEWASVR